MPAFDLDADDLILLNWARYIPEWKGNRDGRPINKN